MLKIESIKILDNQKIYCKFSNGLEGVLDLNKLWKTKDQYNQKLLTTDLYKTAKIGIFGELVWHDLATMKDLNGQNIPCDYDISPELVFENMEFELFENNECNTPQI